MQDISLCLWFDTQAEEAVRFWVSLFPSSKIGRISRYGKEGFEIHGRPEGSVMSVDFELNGRPFTALNGGPQFKFSEAISLQVVCESQEEIDRYWDALTEGGDPAAQQCGWLKDRFGVSWQVFPKQLVEMVSDPNSEKSQRAMKAMLQMKKMDLAQLQAAYEGR